MFAAGAHILQLGHCNTPFLDKQEGGGDDMSGVKLLSQPFYPDAPLRLSKEMCQYMQLQQRFSVQYQNILRPQVYRDTVAKVTVNGTIPDYDGAPGKILAIVRDVQPEGGRSSWFRVLSLINLKAHLGSWQDPDGKNQDLPIEETDLKVTVTIGTQRVIRTVSCASLDTEVDTVNARSTQQGDTLSFILPCLHIWSLMWWAL